MISMIVSIYGCATNFRSARRGSGSSSEEPEPTPVPASSIFDNWVFPENETGIDHTFTGTFEGEGFRISILDGWSETRTGELTHESFAGTLTLITETDVDYEHQLYAYMRRLKYVTLMHAYDNDVINNSKVRAHTSGPFNGSLLCVNIVSDNKSQYTFEFITIENNTAYIIIYETVADEIPDIEMYDVGVMISTLEID